MSARTVLLLHSSGGRYGADRQLRLLATGLDRERYTPLVVLPDLDGPLAAELATAGVETVTAPLAVIRRELMSARGGARLSAEVARSAAALSRLIRRRQVAVVHSNTSVILGGAAAAALTRIPHIWHVREIYSEYGRVWPIHRRLLSSAAALPCVSLAASLQFGRDQRVSVVYDGLAISPGRSLRSAARTKLGLPQDRPVVAMAGRITDWKGQDVLLRALAEPDLASRGAVALIAGDVWPGAEHRLTALESLAAELGVADRVVWPGFVENPGDIYGAADVMTVPSTAPDPLPGAAIEAAAAGCAVVASAHGGLPEIFSDGETGLLIPPSDHVALAAATARLIDDPRLAARIGSVASRDVRGRFGAKRLVADVSALYDDVRG